MEITSRMVEFPSSSPKGKTGGFLAYPNASAKYPGVIVIQEIWGLVENIRDIKETREGGLRGPSRGPLRW